jgi:hypothetical protein
MSEKSLVTNLRVNANDAITPLREYAKAAEASDTALAAMAAKSADAIESLSGRGGKAFERLAATGKLSQSAFDGFLHTVGALREEVVSKFGSIEKAPEPFQRAIKSAEQYLRDMRTEMDASAAQTELLRQEFGQTTEVLEQLDVAVDATEQALEALNAEQVRAAELAAGVAERFGDIPERIEEIRTAGNKTFEEQIDDLKRVASEIADSEKGYRKLKDGGVQALEALRPASQKVEQALKDLAASASTEHGKIRDATIVTERAFENLAKQIRNNPKEAVESLPKAVGAVIQLRNAIETTRAAGGPVDPKAVADLKRFEAQLDKTKIEIGSLKREIDQSTAGVTNATGAWRGMDSIVDQVAGKFGKLGAGIVGGAMAIKEGWTVGTEIAKTIGTDFRAMDQAVADFTSRAKLLNPAILDWLTGAGSFEAVRAAASLTKAELEGYNSAVIAGIEDIGNYSTKTAEFAAIQQAHAVILAEGTEGQRLATQAKRDGGGVLADYVRVLGVASEAATVHNKLVASGAEGERLWNEIRAQGKGNILNLAAAITGQKDAITGLLAKTKEEIQAERDLQIALNDTIAIRVKQLNLEKQQVDLVAQREKVEDGLTASMRTRLAEIAASMVVKEGREIPLTKLQVQQLEQQISTTIGLSDAERAAAQALVDKLKSVEKMTQWQRESLAKEIERKLLVNSTAVADAAHAAVLDKKTRSITNVAGETAKLAFEAYKAEAVTGKLGRGFNRLGAAAEGVETGVRGAGQGLAESAKSIEAANGSTERLAATTVKLVGGLQKLNDGSLSLKSDHLKIAPDTIENLAAYDKELASIVGNMQSIIRLKGDVTAALTAVGEAATKATGSADQ